MKKYLLLFLAFWTVSVFAVTVVDDAGQSITLEQPASRIISMSPHVTEFLFEIAAGSKIVGVTQFSDYPKAAQKVEIVGDYRQVDVERILALKPDLIVAWKSGYPTFQVERLQEQGIPVFFSDPKQLGDLANNYRVLSQLVGTTVGKYKASQLEQELFALQKTYAHQRILHVFFQVSDRPLYTLNGQHIISDAIRLCGGTNSFDSLKTLAPQVSIEAVLEQNPDVILTTTNNVDFWTSFKTLKAVQQQAIYVMEADWITRPGPRFIKGIRQLCERLDQARKNERHP